MNTLRASGKSEVRFVNLTPHPVVLRAENGSETTIPPEPTPARVSSTSGGIFSPAFVVGPGPCQLRTASTSGEVEGLPPPERDTILIVSALLAVAVPGRTDVFYPGTGPGDGAVRDSQGRVQAVTRLIQAAQSPRQRDLGADDVRAALADCDRPGRCDLEASGAMRTLASALLALLGEQL